MAKGTFKSFLTFILAAALGVAAFMAYQRKKDEKDDHVWDAGTVMTAATCADEGERLHVCLDCGETKTVKIPTLPHDWQITPGVNATCTSGGYTSSTYCLSCGKLGKSPTPLEAMGHYFAIIPGTAPTCTLGGVSDGSQCIRCGAWEQRQTPIEALGHNLNENGVCTVCGVVPDPTAEHFAKIISNDTTYVLSTETKQAANIDVEGNLRGKTIKIEPYVGVQLSFYWKNSSGSALYIYVYLGYNGGNQTVYEGGIENNSNIIFEGMHIKICDDCVYVYFEDDFSYSYESEGTVYTSANISQATTIYSNGEITFITTA